MTQHPVSKMINPQQQTQQAALVFECAEQVVQNWIAHILDCDVDALFDKPAIYTKRLYLAPGKKNHKKKGKKFIQLKLSIVPNDYILDQKIIMEHQGVKDTLGFLLYCVKTVYAAIVNAHAIDDVKNIGIALDNNNITYYPTFMHIDLLKYDEINKCVSKLLKQKSENKCDDDWDNNWNITMALLEDTTKKIETNNIIEICKTANDSLRDKKKIGIKMKYISKKKLPSCKLGQTLPKISDVAYEDID